MEGVPKLSGEGECQSASWESVWNGCALKPVSDTSKSTCVAVSSAGNKMQVGEMEERKIKDAERGEQDSRGWV